MSFSHIKRPGMSLRAFRSFVAIARHGSFARAGAAVGLTQSAISLQIKALETDYGVQLFDRGRRKPALTEAGRLLLARAEEVLALYDRIPEALGDERALAGRLRLGVIQTALAGPLPDALIRLYRAHPRLRVHVVAGMSSELAHRLADGELDAAVVTEPLKPHRDGLVATKLYHEDFWLIAPPGHDHDTAPDLLASMPFIRFDSRAWAGQMISRELDRLGWSVKEEMALDSLAVIIRMVEKGLGVAIAPIATEALAELHLSRQPFGDPPLRRNIVLLERPGHPSRPFCQALADAILNRAEGPG